MGAPVKAFNRISSQPLRMHCGVTNPEIVVVIDPTLLGLAEILEGLDEKGTIVVNFEGSPQELREMLGFKGGRVVTVDASRFLRYFGRVVVILPCWVLSEVLPEVSMENLLEAVRSQFGEKLRPEVIDKNLLCLTKACEEAQIDE